MEHAMMLEEGRFAHMTSFEGCSGAPCASTAAMGLIPELSPIRIRLLLPLSHSEMP